MERNIGTYLSFIPVISLIILFFIIPIGYTIHYSTIDTYGNFIGLERFEKVIFSKEFLSAFGYTLEIALISTIVSIIIAIMIAFALRDTFVGKKNCIVFVPMEYLNATYCNGINDSDIVKSNGIGVISIL